MVSVIVPVYNIEKEIAKCIESIRMQTYEDLEIILVNDGSTDASYKICEKFAKEDNRIILVNKEHTGLSGTRKAGLNIAKGEYIAHIDGDDWIEPHYIEQLVNKTEYMGGGKADIVIAGFIEEDGRNSTFRRNAIVTGIYEKKSIEQKVYPYMMEVNEERVDYIFPSLWAKLFKCSILMDVQMNLIDNIQYDEDTIVTYAVVAAATSIVVIPDCSYHYVKRSNSLTMGGTICDEYMQSIHRVYEYLSIAFSKCQNKEHLLLQLETLISRRLLFGIKNYFGISTGNYIFPYERIRQGSIVVLYGA